MTSLLLNGEPVRLRLDPEMPLLFALRDAANLTGARHGCDDGSCHACTVLVDGQPVRGCQMQLRELEGAVVTTIEAFAGRHPVQQAERGDARTASQLQHLRPMARGSGKQHRVRPGAVALRWLDKAVANSSYEESWIAFWPHWDILRDDPRFHALLQQVYGEKLQDVLRASSALR